MFLSKKEGLSVLVIEVVTSELPIIVLNIRGSKYFATVDEYREIVDSFEIQNGLMN